MNMEDDPNYDIQPAVRAELATLRRQRDQFKAEFIKCADAGAIFQPGGRMSTPSMRASAEIIKALSQKGRGRFGKLEIAEIIERETCAWKLLEALHKIAHGEYDNAHDCMFAAKIARRAIADLRTEPVPSAGVIPAAPATQSEATYGGGVSVQDLDPHDVAAAILKAKP